jgi:hypothetical protein
LFLIKCFYIIVKYIKFVLLLFSLSFRLCLVFFAKFIFLLIVKSMFRSLNFTPLFIKLSYKLIFSAKIDCACVFNLPTFSFCVFNLPTFFSVLLSFLCVRFDAPLSAAPCFKLYHKEKRYFKNKINDFLLKCFFCSVPN